MMLSEAEQKQFEAMKTEEPIEEKANVEEEQRQEGQGQEGLLEPKPKVEEEQKKQEEKPERTVKLEALHEERAKRKELQKQLNDMQEKFARVDERLKVLHPEKKEEAPDPNDDPLGYERHQRQQLQRQIEDSNKTATEIRDKLSRDLKALEFKSFIERQETLFEREHPDYQEAMNYVIALRTSELDEIGIEGDEREEYLRRGMSMIVQTAVEKGKNPAQAVYNMATKLGYKKKEQEKTIEQIEKGVKNASSLGAAGGKAGGVLTAESLAEMSDEDFKKIDFKDFKKVLGG